MAQLAFNFPGTLRECLDFCNDFAKRYQVKGHWGHANSPVPCKDPDWRRCLSIYPKEKLDIGPDGEIIARAVPGEGTIVTVDSDNAQWLVVFDCFQREALRRGIKSSHLTLEKKREMVKQMTEVKYKQGDIADAIHETVDFVKNQRRWLREHGKLPPRET